jgi:hypothetical protein
MGNLLDRKFFVKTHLFDVIGFSHEIICQISRNWWNE